MTQRRWTRLVLGLGFAVVAVIGASALGGAAGGSGTGDPVKDIASVRKSLADMDKKANSVFGKLEAAKRGKDIIKVACVHDNLRKIRDIIALAREQYSKYLADQTSGTGGGQQTVGLVDQMTIMGERVDEHVAAAERCAGETVQVTDQAKVTEEVDPTIPQWDPTQPAAPIWAFPRPPEGSPYI
jgi:hypothetical protein